MSFLLVTTGLDPVVHADYPAAWIAGSKPAEAATFFGHLSMMGGMLFVVAFGAGAYSLDALRRRD